MMECIFLKNSNKYFQKIKMNLHIMNNFIPICLLKVQILYFEKYVQTRVICIQGIKST